MTIGIYKITSPTGRIYIGQSRNIENRFRQYRNDYKNKTYDYKLFRSFYKYGLESHFFDVIETCDIKDLNYRERHYQDYYDSASKSGLNSQLVGTTEKPYVISDETRQKISASNKGKAYSKGIKRSELVKKNAVDVWYKNRGLNRPIEKPENIIIYKNKTTDNPRQVCKFSLNWDLIKTYNSLMDAEIETGISTPCIIRVCKGRGYTAGGFIWLYKKDFKIM